MKKVGIEAPFPIEIWGGVECSMCRVENRRVRGGYYDELKACDHLQHPKDLDLIASLGIRTLRYPVRFEQIAPKGIAAADWSWSDARMEKLQALGITPIVGLLHHGSGPKYTSLVDPAFPELLAEYAQAVASRYPWISDFTPINEILTTARFSGLYGHWYPHGKDGRTFLTAFLNQCKAVVLSMRAIRSVTPHARLIQTEDMGKVYSTPKLAYQADFENERRFIALDILSGRFTSSHPMWNYFLYLGGTEEELTWFTRNPCPPDILGINYYVTSERFLDENVDSYPQHTHGGNGRDAYADVEAVRVPHGSAGAEAILQEVWDRYHLPIAVTEVHLGCTREEQMRWLRDMWIAANTLAKNGVDIRAITPWSLLGAYDWDSLLTEFRKSYEPGAFDLRIGDAARGPRPTALAAMIKDLAVSQTHAHPVLEQAGWWNRPTRLLYPPAEYVPSMQKFARSEVDSNRPILIFGKNGTLGRAFAKACELRGLPYVTLSRTEADITRAECVERAIQKYAPWAVINAAGYVKVDLAEQEQAKCFIENVNGALAIAQACEKRALPLIAFSSDLVFDGMKSAPYVESDLPQPSSIYGQSKMHAEKCVLQACSRALVVRTSTFFGPWDEYNFLSTALEKIMRGENAEIKNDWRVSPTYVPHLTHACLDLLIDAEKGIWHLVNDGNTTMNEMVRRAADVLSLPHSTRERSERRIQMSSVLGSERGMMLPTLEKALEEYVQAFRARILIQQEE